MPNNLEGIFEQNDLQDSINEMTAEYEVKKEDFDKFCEEVVNIFAATKNVNPIQVITVLRESIGIYYGGELIGDQEKEHLTIKEAVAQAYEKHVIGYSDSLLSDYEEDVPKM